jgi:hypothetical protein
MSSDESRLVCEERGGLEMSATIDQLGGEYDVDLLSWKPLKANTFSQARSLMFESSNNTSKTCIDCPESLVWIKNRASALLNEIQHAFDETESRSHQAHTAVCCANDAWCLKVELDKESWCDSDGRIPAGVKFRLTVSKINEMGRESIMKDRT